MLFGCGNKVDRNKVIGTYAINIRGASDVIELDPSGTYHHRYKGEDGREVVATDTWEFETVEGSPTVTLHNFKCQVDGVNALGKGYFLLKVTSGGGKCRLWVGVDRQIFFEQTKDAGVQ
jgi:hypothetical protein